MNFVDQVRIKVRSGDGGNGIVAWRREKYEPLGGPAGGTGGRGGHVILEATTDLSTLLDFHYKQEFKAFNGERGGPKNRHGKDGKDLLIKVPPGTVVTDCKNDKVIADLHIAGSTAMVAQGGRGGRGNSDMASGNRRAPHYCEPGEEGIERELDLTLKLLADIGIIGLPNAGKSTFLSVVTAAKPKIADYPFSTLAPNLGVMRKPDGDGIVLADIPGLISGASTGAGLGHEFLRHIERTRLLLHMVDITSDTLEQDIATINEELGLYDKRLLDMPQILFLNKTDLLDAELTDDIASSIQAKQASLFPRPDSLKKIMAGSAGSTQGIDQLKNELMEALSKTAEKDFVFNVLDDEDAVKHPDNGFHVSRRKGTFFVEGNRVERMLSVTNLRSPESLQHFFHVLRAMGIIDALKMEGIQEGSELVIGKTSFTYGEEIF
jgi:GTPase